jgi:hypothetical protein
MQWLETRTLGRHVLKIDRVIYKDGFHRRDLHGLFRARTALGFDVHSQFLHDGGLFGVMHAQDWIAETRRPIRANFMGCQDPEIRKQTLDTIRALFGAGEQAGKKMFWHEYTNAAPVGLDPREFVRILTDSDFTLCPRGYSLVTHRPVEALLRGSIPVLAQSELDLYGVDLVDGENCIAVAEARWVDAVERLAAVDEESLARMRHNIRALVDAHLRYDRLAADLRRRIGVERQEP